MLFRYAHHALERRGERKVSQEEAEHCVLNATSVFRTRKNNQYRAVVSGRKLKVVVAADRDTDVEKFIVTVIVEDDDAS